MYNRYIRNDSGPYEHIPYQDQPFGGSTGCGNGGSGGILSGLLEKFNLKDMDKGDLLLLFILFLLLREGEDEELLIALGLLLIL